MPCRLGLVLQGLPASVTARTPGPLRDPQDAQRPWRVSSPPPTVSRPPESPLFAKAVDPQLQERHTLPSSSLSWLAKMEGIPSLRDSQKHLLGWRPARAA